MSWFLSLVLIMCCLVLKEPDRAWGLLEGNILLIYVTTRPRIAHVWLSLFPSVTTRPTCSFIPFTGSFLFRGLAGEWGGTCKRGRRQGYTPRHILNMLQVYHRAYTLTETAWSRKHTQPWHEKLDADSSTAEVWIFFFSNFPYFVLNHPYSIRKRKKIVIAVVGLILHGNIFLVLMVLFLASFFFFL